MAMECAFFGFMGAILIVQPGSDAFSPSTLFPIFAAFCYALYIVTMRLFDEDAPNPVIYICASVASGITANLFALIYGDISPINSLKQASMIL